MTLHQDGEEATFTNDLSAAGGVLAYLPFDAQIDFKPIMPKMISPAKFRFEVLRELEAIAKMALDLYKKTTAGWSFQPQFSYKRSDTGGQGGLMAAFVHGDVGVAVSVVENGEMVEDKGYTTAQIYTFVDRGVPPHTIQAGGKFPMGFLPGYLARTEPNSLGSGESRRYGEKVYAWEVVQGIEARNFSERISDIIQEEIDTRIPDAIQRGLNKAIVQ